MNTGHPRDVDPSITGQPHQVTGKVPDLMGDISRTLGNSVDMPAAVRVLVPPHLCDTAPGDAARVPQAAPRCSASHTAVDSRTPSSTALAQWAIHAAMPCGVPET